MKKSKTEAEHARDQAQKEREGKAREGGRAAMDRATQTPQVGAKAFLNQTQNPEGIHQA